MKNVPAELGGFKLMVTEVPEMKVKVDEETGEATPVTDFASGEPTYKLGLFAKVKEAGKDGFRPKGEEINVTIVGDPGELEEGMYVELSGVTTSPYAMHGKNNCNINSGLSFRAQGLRVV